jgi:hypothetical protein
MHQVELWSRCQMICRSSIDLMTMMARDVRHVVYVGRDTLPCHMQEDCPL